VLIPLLPTPNQEQLPLKTNVCAYGGASGYVCGEIADFEATITVNNEPFHPVTKVFMNKPCLEGDMGAPVYVTTNIIYNEVKDSIINVSASKELYASPVGQVVEAVGASTEQNT